MKTKNENVDAHEALCRHGMDWQEYGYNIATQKIGTTVTKSRYSLEPDEWLVLTTKTSSSCGQFIVLSGVANIDRDNRKGIYKLLHGESVEITPGMTAVVRNLTNQTLHGVLLSFYSKTDE